MNHQLNFAVKHIYNSLGVGITIKTTLRLGNVYTICDAKVDTGSEFCLFARELGEELDIDIETGFKKNLITLSGNLTAYGHSLELETLGLKFILLFISPKIIRFREICLADKVGFNSSNSVWTMRKARFILVRKLREFNLK